MDTGILLKVIEDIQDEEKSAKIQSLLQNIVSYYDASDPTSLNTTKEQIYEAVTSSRISQYALSDYQVLERLNVERLFGPGLYQNLDDALSAQSHEVKVKLQQLVTERETALASLTELNTALGKFDFESRALDDSHYEIGFVLPASYADLAKTEKAIKDLGQLLNALSDAVDVQQPLKIKYVSNGSIEIFLDVAVELAQNFDVVIDYALKVYAAIEMFKGIKKQYKKYSVARKKKAEKLADEEKKEQVEKLVDELIQTLGIKEEADKTAVTILFKQFLKHIEAGVGAEVHTPKTAEPEEPATEAKPAEKKAYRESLKAYEKKKEIDSRNREIFILQQNNFYGMDTKFLDDGVDEIEDEEAEENNQS
jgi:hypothetical protein